MTSTTTDTAHRVQSTILGEPERTDTNVGPPPPAQTNSNEGAVSPTVPHRHQDRHGEPPSGEKYDIVARATAEITSDEPATSEQAACDDMAGIAGLWSAEGEDRATEHIVDLIHTMADGTGRRVLPFDEVMQHCTDPVSYTHLTLPTTPYV